MVLLVRHMALFVFLIFLTACSKALVPSTQKIIQEKYIDKNTSISGLDKYSRVLSGKDSQLLRRQINGSIKSCESIVLQDNILYAKVYFFDSHVTACFSKLKERNGIIIDLRENHGGVLEEAISLVDMYLESGVIIKKKSRDREHIYYAKKTNTYPDIPLVILVDKGSASASEIVAGSLQKHQRATIIGTTTFGKGTIQEIIPLQDQKILKLTVAKYYLPGDIDIEGKGIVPDIRLSSKYPHLHIKDKRLRPLLHYKFSKNMDNALLLAVHVLGLMKR